MKRLWYALPVLLCIFVIIIFHDHKQYPKVDIVYLPYGETDGTCIYYITQENRVIGVPVELVSTNVYEKIEEVFQYLTSQSNSVGVAYHTALVPSTYLKTYKVKDKTVTLNVSDDFYRYNKKEIERLLAQILYSYREIGFETVKLEINNVLVEQLENVLLSNGIPDCPTVNIIYETKNTQEAQIVRVKYAYPNGSKIIFHYVIDKAIDKTQFMIEKTIQFLVEEYSTNLQFEQYVFRNDSYTLYFKEAVPNEYESKVFREVFAETVYFKVK